MWAEYGFLHAEHGVDVRFVVRRVFIDALLPAFSNYETGCAFSICVYFQYVDLNSFICSERYDTR